MDDDALIFMAGEGASLWLEKGCLWGEHDQEGWGGTWNSSHPLSDILGLLAHRRLCRLRAAPHAMVVPSTTASRLWYGKMLLPPPGQTLSTPQLFLCLGSLQC